MDFVRDEGHTVPLQRCLRDLRTISVRNLYSFSSLVSTVLPDTFFTVSVLCKGLHSSNNEYIPVYQSELSQHSLNPTWLPLEWATDARLPREQQRNECETLLTQSQIVLRVFARVPSPSNKDLDITSQLRFGEYFPSNFCIDTSHDVLVTEFEIDLRDSKSLCFLGFDVTKVLATKRAVTASSTPSINSTMSGRRALDRDTQGDTDLVLSSDASAYNLDALPINSLIISLKDGHYVSSETHKLIHKSNLDKDKSLVSSQSVTSVPNPSLLTTTTTPSSSSSSSEEYFEKHDMRRAFDAINRLMQLRRDSLAADTERMTALQEVASELNSQNTIIEKDKLTDKVKRVFELRKSRDALFRAAERAEISALSEKARLARSSQCVREAAEKMQSVSRLLEPMQAELTLRHDAVLSVHGLITAKQLSLLSEIRSLYPIQEQEKGKRYSIRGIVLPHESAFSTAPEEQVSTALGYTCHLISLASKYLQVPLRYLPQHFVSRSSIKDEILMHTREWPLYLKGVDRDQIRVGFRMLQRDVKQVLSSQGIAYVENGHVLLNLSLLFSSLLDVPVPDRS
jgi:hypothetical protein